MKNCRATDYIGVSLLKSRETVKDVFDSLFVTESDSCQSTLKDKFTCDPLLRQTNPYAWTGVFLLLTAVSKEKNKNNQVEDRDSKIDQVKCSV